MKREELLNDLYEWLDSECIPATMTADLSHDFADILRAKLDKIKESNSLPPAEGAETGINKDWIFEIIDKTNDYAKQLITNHFNRHKPQPTADAAELDHSLDHQHDHLEGAEEILEKYGFKIMCHKEAADAINDVFVQPIVAAMHEFATLHARKMAEEMVKEKCKKCKYRGLPDSIQEALNSGDGVYRP